MPDRPIEFSSEAASRPKSRQSQFNATRQHGQYAFDSSRTGVTRSSGRKALLDIPSESLTHITSFLDSSTLLALSRTNKRLYAHVKDDNTWRCAYIYQFLGISPEDSVYDGAPTKLLMLRRVENTWRREFISRHDLCRRWQSSRNTTITHIPHHSLISKMCLISPTALLTTSMQYGIVARSHPLTGKIVRGFLDASGVVNGLGIGNPNAEFSPMLTACALTSEGNTARVLWGFRNGEVALTTASKVMDAGRSSAAKYERCMMEECHEGAVMDAVGNTGANGMAAFVTGAADGRVKMWNAKRLCCLWTSERNTGLIPDPCVKVAFDAPHGVVAGAKKSGDICVWTGFSSDAFEGSGQQQLSPHAIYIPYPGLIKQLSTGLYLADTDTLKEVMELRLDCSFSGRPSLLVAYHNDSQFYRVICDPSLTVREVTAFGDPSAGPVHAIQPVFAREGEPGFVLVGDQLGYINVYEWDIPVIPAVLPVRRFEAHEDGAVTALACNFAILATGSSQGTVKIWDSLTFTSLRSYSSTTRPSLGPDWDMVSQIILTRDLLVVSVGSRVVAWQAGPASKGGNQHVKSKSVRTWKTSGVAKGHKSMELYHDITESRLALEEEQGHIRQAFGREREQQSTLEYLGLSEAEAVEYVLMLSRDQERRRVQDAATSLDSEGVFMADFDDVQIPESSPFRRDSSAAGSSSFAGRPSSSVDGLPLTRASLSPSTSHHKLQVLPRLAPEPMEAGSLVDSHITPEPRDSIQPFVSDSEEHFPTISSSNSSAGTSIASIPFSAVSRRQTSGSPRSVPSVWNSPSRPLSVLSSPHGFTILPSPSVSPSVDPASRLSSFSSSAHTREIGSTQDPDYDIEDDLRFAIELSLAEARSRGEDV